MPYSIVINLLPRTPIYPHFLTGRHLHALFLTLVSYVDKDLGNSLHFSRANKSFSLSPLQVKERQTPRAGETLQWQHRQTIEAGTPCWWRISLLDDRLFAGLTKLWLNINPDHPWHLGSADIIITSILGTPDSGQPWANFSTYEQLYHGASESDRSFRFSLVTPAAFRQHTYDSCLPTRELVFNSLLSRWNRLSEIEIPSIAIDSIFPCFFDIRTEMVADSRSKFIGCVGDINYRLLGEVPPFGIKCINALSDFAFYCGIGRKTTMGMGMARRIFTSH
ncbi:MAG: hypothetical protein N5P05_002255 [Chroococcopsis gigantea SAG 12.99]|jgi:CRISPR-associated endoribonuclease Cas6|nr:hypothetical protein [Chroococcopsis gigantea SAG 12.99]